MHTAFKIFVSLITIKFCAFLNAENIDFVIERFCFPQKLDGSASATASGSVSASLSSSSSSNSRARQLCECNGENAPLWGIPTLNIDCSYKELKGADLNEMLPLYTTSLDLSWNTLDRVPLFASDSLHLLNLMHNNITTLTSKNFVKISNLHELYLSWNSIQAIEWNSFDDLAHLRVLDLSHNNLHSLSLQIFKPMIILESLSLSWNRKLNQTDGIEELDFYQTFGLNGNLRTLDLEACNLVNLSLPLKAPLEVLNLRRNRLIRVPSRLPYSLKKIDISENLMESLRSVDTVNLASVRELYIEDMPRLQCVEENAFASMRALEKLSFQNSRRLTSINANAFGETGLNDLNGSNDLNGTAFPSLKTIIFRGTMLHGFNATLASIFRQLTELDLNGMPIYCDCELIWFKTEIQLETNGRCYKPSRLRGMLIGNAHVSDFSCNTWPQWLYGLIIFGLIILCSFGIYLIVLGLRPHNGVTLRRKVGAGSPYARVTIEPNRQEHFT